jgi:hypothetical protein
MEQLVDRARVAYALDAMAQVVSAPPGRQEDNPHVSCELAGPIAAAMAEVTGGSRGAWALSLELLVCPASQVDVGSED